MACFSHGNPWILCRTQLNVLAQKCHLFHHDRLRISSKKNLGWRETIIFQERKTHQKPIASKDAPLKKKMGRSTSWSMTLCHGANSVKGRRKRTWHTARGWKPACLSFAIDWKCTSMFFCGGGLGECRITAGHELAKCPSPVLNHVFTYVLQRQTAKKNRPRNENTKRILENVKVGQVTVNHQPLGERLWGWVFTVYQYN